jgi:hypothetical protein
MIRYVIRGALTAAAAGGMMLCIAAGSASAQMPPRIQGPIDAAKRQANKTSNQINNEQKIGDDAKAAAMPAAPSQAPSKGVAAAGQKGAVTPASRLAAQAAAAKAAASADSAKKRGSVSQSGAKGTVTFYRETFTYDRDKRRDPFLSLMGTGELRPMISDLALVGIIYDETGHNSVAILTDASQGGLTYRKKVGDTLGRMKVVKITDHDITLNVDEFGFSRQETLPMSQNSRTGAGASATRRPQ